MSANLNYDEFVKLVGEYADKIGGSPYTTNLGQMLLTELKTKPTREQSDDGKQFIFKVNLGDNVYTVWSRVAKPTVLSLKQCPKDTPWANKKEGTNGTIYAGQCKLVLT